MLWFWVLACLSSNDADVASNPVENAKREVKQEKEQSEQALKAINHLHFVERIQAPVTKVHIWSRSPNPLMERLTKLLAVEVQTSVTLVSTDGRTLSLLLLRSGDRVPKIPVHNRTLFVLEGEWSQQQLAAIAGRGEGYIHIDSSVQRFRSVKQASVMEQALAVSYELRQEYELEMVHLSEDSSTIHPAMWYLANPAWIESVENATDPRILGHRFHRSSNPLIQLTQITHHPRSITPSEYIHSPEPWVRAQAFQWVETEEALQKGIEDDSSVVRIVAAHRLATLMRQQSTEKGCQLLDSLTTSTQAYERWKAAYGLGFCPGREHRLVQLFQDVDIDVVRQAVLSIAQLENVEKYWPEILRLTQHDNSFVRRWAWKTAGRLNVDAVEEHLITCVESEPSVLAKEECARSLHQRGIHTDTPRYTPPDLKRNQISLSQAVQHPDPTYRKDVAKYLPSISGGEDALSTLLQDSDGEVRKAAVESLGYAGSPLVWKAVMDVDPDVQVAALEAIRQQRMDGDCTELLPLLSHSDVEILLRSTEAMGSLSNLTPTCKAAVQALSQREDVNDERLNSALVAIDPTVSVSESLLVQYTLATSKNTLMTKPSEATMTQWSQGTSNQQAWIRGLIQQQDDLCHEVFSWNDPADKPLSHRGVRPPNFSPYGHPNRG